MRLGLRKSDYEMSLNWISEFPEKGGSQKGIMPLYGTMFVFASLEQFSFTLPIQLVSTASQTYIGRGHEYQKLVPIVPEINLSSNSSQSSLNRL